MIRVKVFTPFGLPNKKLDERGWMELPEGATFGKAAAGLGMPGPVAKICMLRLNGEALPFNTPLKDSDVISCVVFIRGG
ncbi:MAG: MoaD/ThiS family protein [Oscillospiraceae bacterium]|nr:MoaD/ThiS family protein [Oscillospiraceae bacterium]